MKIKANGKLYDFPSGSLDLGEARLIKKEFGVVFGRDEADLFDPDWAAAFLYRAMRQAEPEVAPKFIIEAVNATTELDFVNDDGSELTDDDEADAPPTEDAEASATGS